jgi:hypothetical protein
MYLFFNSKIMYLSLKTNDISDIVGKIIFSRDQFIILDLLKNIWIFS